MEPLRHRSLLRFVSVAVAVAVAMSTALAPSAAAQFPQPEVAVACVEGARHTLRYGEHTTGCAIDVATDTDVFEFLGTVDDKVRFRVRSHTPGLDPRVRTFDPDGNLVTDNVCSGNNTSGAIRCSFVVSLNLTLSGTWTIIVTDSGTNETGAYQIQLERWPPPQDADVPTLPWGAAVSDTVEPVTDLDFLKFEARAGSLPEVSVCRTHWHRSDIPAETPHW